ncbi:MAG: GxGYxYP domain-containing protein, partial [Eubacteriales bacterium]
MNKLYDYIVKTIIPVIMAFFVSVSSIAQTWFNFEKYRFAKGEDVVDYLPQTIAPPRDEIYLIDRDRLNDSTYPMITSLQGIVAQTQTKIYIYDSNRIVFVNDFLSANPNITPVYFNDPWKLIEQCKSYLTDNGFILYERGGNPTINMAATISGVERWLIVDATLAATAIEHGLIMKRDLTIKSNGEFTATQAGIFAEYKDRLNNTFVLHQPPGNIFTRDYSIAIKAPCLFVDEKDKAGVAFRETVFAWARGNSMLFGWTTDEGTYVERASAYGLNVIASDFCMNISFMASLKNSEPIEQKNTAQKITADKTKHYVAIVMSDGDNLQWFEGGFSFANSHFGRRQALDTTYKMSWTAPPISAELEPTMMKRVYATASANDNFVCGVSGIGYINPSRYPAKFLNNFVNYTGYEMKKSDIKIVALLDGVSGFKWIWEQTAFKPALQYFAKNENIDGGLIQSGNVYAGLGGKIYWSCGKPFISCGLSFWCDSNENGNAPKAWIEDFAGKVNSLPANIHNQEGYTYLNVHPWSTNMENVNYLVSLLDDDVVLVTAEELVQLVKDNVWH